MIKSKNIWVLVFWIFSYMSLFKLLPNDKYWEWMEKEEEMRKMGLVMPPKHKVSLVYRCIMLILILWPVHYLDFWLSHDVTNPVKHYVGPKEEYRDKITAWCATYTGYIPSTNIVLWAFPGIILEHRARVSHEYSWVFHNPSPYGGKCTIYHFPPDFCNINENQSPFRSEKRGFRNTEWTMSSLRTLKYSI